MAAVHFEQVQRFILAKKIFWGSRHLKEIKMRNKTRLKSFSLEIHFNLQHLINYLF